MYNKVSKPLNYVVFLSILQGYIYPLATRIKHCSFFPLVQNKG